VENEVAGVRTDVAVLSDSEAALRWDDLVLACGVPAFQQGYRWGEYKRASGWRPVRCVLSSPEGIWGLAQCLVKEFNIGKAAVVWLPGGPLLDRQDLDEFLLILKKMFEGWWLYVRVDLPGPADGQILHRLKSSKWRRPMSRLNSGQTIMLSLYEEEEARRRRLSSNWRHNLARGERHGVLAERWKGPGDLDLLIHLYCKMVAFKRIPPALTEVSLQQMIRIFGDRFLVMVARDRSGQVVAARGAGWLGPQGYDLFAATSEAGRKIYASYVAAWRLFEELRSEGVTTYDLAGVDRKNVPGVFTFKQGTGGALVERCGEWEWSQSAVVRLAVNAWVKATWRR